MADWIFVVVNQKGSDGTVSARNIYDGLMKEQLWGWDQKPHNFKALKDGDRVVFYLGAPLMQFAGIAKLKGEPYPRSEEEKQKVRHAIGIEPGDYGIRLSEVQLWSGPRDVKALVPSLSFIENELNWNVYFMGGIRKISADDFDLIAKGSSSPTLSLDTEKQSNFDILEAHLEESIARNWNSINFGRRLRLYSDGETNGRQFDADGWSIDFLTVDEETGDFVIIELKRGRTSDCVIGQAARYIVWVREKLAKPSQQVYAIIITHEVDDKLRTAIRFDPRLSLKEYKIRFELQDVPKA